MGNVGLVVTPISGVISPLSLKQVTLGPTCGRGLIYDTPSNDACNLRPPEEQEAKTWGCGTPSKWSKLRINGCYQPLPNWDDPPSRGGYSCKRRSKRLRNKDMN